jgi:DNA primase
VAVVDLLNRLEGVKETGPNRWLAQCPAHHDRSPSLSVRDADDRLLIHCFAGCEPLDIVQAVGLELSDLFADQHEHVTTRHSRIPVRDILEALDHEAHVVAIIASDIHDHKEIDESTWDRLALAVSRIGNARAYA